MNEHTINKVRRPVLLMIIGVLFIIIGLILAAIMSVGLISKGLSPGMFLKVFCETIVGLFLVMSGLFFIIGKKSARVFYSISLAIQIIINVIDLSFGIVMLIPLLVTLALGSLILGYIFGKRCNAFFNRDGVINTPHPWTCEKCYTRNPITEIRCIGCNHKKSVTPFAVQQQEPF